MHQSASSLNLILSFSPVEVLPLSPQNFTKQQLETEFCVCQLFHSIHYFDNIITIFWTLSLGPNLKQTLRVTRTGIAFLVIFQKLHPAKSPPPGTNLHQHHPRRHPQGTKGPQRGSQQSPKLHQVPQKGPQL